MRRGRLLLGAVQAVLLTLGVLAASAIACEGAGEEGAASTTLSTKLSGEGKEGEEVTVLEGTKVKDKATLSGRNASSATGKATYKVYTEKECKTLFKSMGEVTVSGESVPASSEEELEGGKTYYWQAHYGGDSKNKESTSACTEVLKVKARTTLSTKLSGESREGGELTILEGSKAKDKATVEGTNASTAEGKVLYKVFSDSRCEREVERAGEEIVTSGSGAASEEKELPGGKTYYWQATYKGDSLHEESRSECAREILNVKAQMTLSTNLSGEGESGGLIEVQEAAKTHDVATLEGTNVSTATGTVKYDIYQDSACTELVGEAGERSLESGGKAPGSDEEKLTVGDYYWQATYSGDATHTAATSPCDSEIEVVVEDTSLSTTLLGETAEGESTEGAEVTVIENGAADDTATLSGANASIATGTVTYDVYSDSECKDFVTEAGETLVTAGIAPSSGAVLLPPGTYYWQASYSGDSSNKPSTSTCGSEVERVISAPITTSLSGESQSGAHIEVQEAAGVQDTATLHEENASTATGTVTYKVYADSECKELVAEAGTVTLESGGKIPASSEEKLAAGTYYWEATYSGDLSHAAATAPCGAEVDTVAESTSLSSSLSGEGHEGSEIEVHEGAPVADEAVLSGADSSLASGAVAYSVYSDSECKELVAAAGSVDVTGGMVPSSNELTLPEGTYYWQATYYGDTLNKGSTGACGAEIEKVTTARLTNELSGGGKSGPNIELEEEAAVTDTATLHEPSVGTATGKVRYTVYATDECTTPVDEAGEVTVTAGRIPPSSSETLPEGTYYWQAHYSGDGSHEAATSPCNVQNVKMPWIISVGDSYISGEGARRAGNNEEFGTEPTSLNTALPNAPYWGIDNSWTGNNEVNRETIPMCHRSRSAEIFIGVDEARQRVEGRNVACSGAQTTSRSEGGVFTPGLDFANARRNQPIDAAKPDRGKCPLTVCEGQARQLQSLVSSLLGGGKRVKLVVISIGGNNFKFGEVIEACVWAWVLPARYNPCRLTERAKFEEPSLGAREAEIETGINMVGRAMQNAGYAKGEYTLLVQDYPSPIPEPAQFRFAEGAMTTNRFRNVTRRWAAGCPILNGDATWMNQTALPAMNRVVKNAAENVRAALRYQIAFLELESALMKHRLCEQGLRFVGEGTPPTPANWRVRGAAELSEWVNPIKRSPERPFEWMESIHPDYWAQLALRNCLRQAYNNGTILSGKKCVVKEPQAMRQPPLVVGGGFNAWLEEPVMRLE